MWCIIYVGVEFVIGQGARSRTYDLVDIDWVVCNLDHRLGICTYYRHGAPAQGVIMSSLIMADLTGFDPAASSVTS